MMNTVKLFELNHNFPLWLMLKKSLNMDKKLGIFIVFILILLFFYNLKQGLEVFKKEYRTTKKPENV